MTLKMIPKISKISKLTKMINLLLKGTLHLKNQMIQILQMKMIIYSLKLFIII